MCVEGVQEGEQSIKMRRVEEVWGEGRALSGRSGGSEGREGGSHFGYGAQLFLWVRAGRGEARGGGSCKPDRTQGPDPRSGADDLPKVCRSHWAELAGI